jgi:hypothetical protein
MDLSPVIISLVHFGDTHLAGPEGRPVLHRHVVCGNLFDPVLVCSACGEPVSPRDVVIEPGPGARERSPDLSTDAGEA